MTRSLRSTTILLTSLWAALAAGADGAFAFDHARYDALLRAHARPDGVAYEALSADAAKLDEYLAQLAAARLDALSRDERLALLINAYNACTLRLILDHYPLKSIRDIPEEKRWKHRRWVVAGRTLSLDELENEVIRPDYNEPRIHFAINCASRGCPPLRAEAFVAPRLEAQLEEQARRAHADARFLELTPGGVRLTKLYEWFATDFTAGADSVLQYAARYSEPLAARLRTNPAPRIEWIEYDWTLNQAGR